VSEAPALAVSEERAPNLIPPPGNPRFPLFDALRAIAALSVFLGHTVTEVLPLATHRSLFIWALTTAYQGVAIFFLVSGFLLYRPFLVARRGGPSLSLPAYAKRRFLRIAPAYWAALSMFLAAGFVQGVSTHNWWVFYAFGQIYSPNTIGSGIGVAWTLCIEVTFYAALPLFALLAARLGGGRSARPDLLLLVVLAGASLAFRAHYSAFGQSGTFFWFACGMALALASVTAESAGRRARPAWIPRAWPLLSWAAGAGLFVLLHELEVRTAGISLALRGVIVHILYGLAALLLLLPAVFGEREGGPVRRLLALPALAWVGLVSYAFYLYHSIVIAQLDKLVHVGLTGRYLLVGASSLVISLACAAVSYYALERPVMVLGRRRRGSGDPGPSPQAMNFRDRQRPVR
jgi:peptidoglycan/LPS O-acetylase OafA/YrhL